MAKCQYCGAELPKNETVCEFCDSENAERQTKSEKKENRSSGVSPKLLQLIKAVESGSVERLVEAYSKGADINERTPFGETALHFACRKGNLAIVRKLVEMKADLFIKSLKDSMPIHEACLHGHKSIVELLLSNGVGVDSEGLYKKTPLIIALENNQTALAKFLLSEGANTYVASEKSGKTPLHVAIEHQNDEVFHIILEKGADFDRQDRNGWSPLHAAIKSRNPKMVKALLGLGADKDTKTLKGQTPLDIARQDNHKEILALLGVKAEGKQVKNVQSNRRPFSAKGLLIAIKKIVSTIFLTALFSSFVVVPLTVWYINDENLRMNIVSYDRVSNMLVVESKMDKVFVGLFDGFIEDDKETIIGKVSLDIGQREFGFEYSDKKYAKSLNAQIIEADYRRFERISYSKTNNRYKIYSTITYIFRNGDMLFNYEQEMLKKTNRGND